MLPWLGWKAFWFGSVTDIGNGGPLLQPKGQTSVLYTVPPRSGNTSVEKKVEEEEVGEKET